MLKHHRQQFGSDGGYCMCHFTAGNTRAVKLRNAIEILHLRPVVITVCDHIVVFTSAMAGGMILDLRKTSDLVGVWTDDFKFL